MSDDDTVWAVRAPGRRYPGKAHRQVPHGPPEVVRCCTLTGTIERLPIADVPVRDRCRICWHPGADRCDTGG